MAQNIALAPAEEVKEANDDGELPVVDARAGDVEAVDVDSEQAHEVGEHANG